MDRKEMVKNFPIAQSSIRTSSNSRKQGHWSREFRLDKKHKREREREVSNDTMYLIFARFIVSGH